MSKDQRYIDLLRKAIDKSNEEVHALRMEGKHTEALFEYEYGRGLNRALLVYEGMLEPKDRVNPMDLSNVSTCDLVRELRHREGVESTTVELHEDMMVRVNSHVLVLVIKD